MKMKYLALLVFIFGLVVIFLLPALHIISHFLGVNLVSLKDYFLALVLLYLAVDVVIEKGRRKSETENKS
jgi:hypothetical protein